MLRIGLKISYTEILMEKDWNKSSDGIEVILIKYQISSEVNVGFFIICFISSIDTITKEIVFNSPILREYVEKLKKK